MRSAQKSINVLYLVLLFFGVLVACSAVAPALAQSRSTQTPLAVQTTGDCDGSRTVSVSGASLVNVTPDRVLIQLGVQSNGLTPTQVQTDNQRAMEKVKQAIKALGVENKDIATDLYVIDPVYNDYNSLAIEGYRINNSLAVTLKDISKTSGLIAAALEAGANQVINVEFYTSDLRKYRDQAREMAIQAAEEKAAALAGAAGAKPGCVISIQENTSSYYNGWWSGSSQNLWTQNSVQNVASSGTSMDDELGPVSLGMIGVKAEVNVTYSLK